MQDQQNQDSNVENGENQDYGQTGNEDSENHGGDGICVGFVLLLIGLASFWFKD